MLYIFKITLSLIGQSPWEEIAEMFTITMVMLKEEETKLINGSKMAKAIDAIKHGHFSFGKYLCSFLFLLLQP